MGQPEDPLDEMPSLLGLHYDGEMSQVRLGYRARTPSEVLARGQVCKVQESTGVSGILYDLIDKNRGETTYVTRTRSRVRET